MATVVIVHRWGGDSECDWIPWLKEELEKREVRVIVPNMPNPNRPTIDSWVPFLANECKDANEDFYFVGHSIGCQTILRYLATLPQGKKVGGAVLVAGFMTLDSISDDEKEIAKEWTGTPIDWAAAASHSNAFTYIYSDDDPYVPVSNAKLFKEKINAKLVLDSGRGHFTESDDVTQLPVLLDELLVIMGLPVETTPI